MRRSSARKTARSRSCSGRRSFAAALVLGGALALSAPASAGSGVQPPDVSLQVGSKKTTDYAIAGQWYTAPGTVQDCPALIIDPAPGLPRALNVRRGRHRSEVVYRTPRRPADAIVLVGRPGRALHGEEVELERRRNSDGQTVAWAASFEARVRGRLNIFPSAVWRDENGCGREYIEAFFRLR